MPAFPRITRVTIRGVAQFYCDFCGAPGVGDNFCQQLKSLEEAAAYVPRPYSMPSGWSSSTNNGRLVYRCPKCLGQQLPKE